jgi:hypothetical protein
VLSPTNKRKKISMGRVREMAMIDPFRGTINNIAANNLLGDPTTIMCMKKVMMRRTASIKNPLVEVRRTTQMKGQLEEVRKIIWIKNQLVEGKTTLMRNLLVVGKTTSMRNLLAVGRTT